MYISLCCSEKIPDVRDQGTNHCSGELKWHLVTKPGLWNLKASNDAKHPLIVASFECSTRPESHHCVIELCHFLFLLNPPTPPLSPPGPWSKMAKTRNLIAWDSWTRVNHLIVVLCMLCRRSTKGWAKKRDVVGIDFGWTRRWQLANKFQGADKVDRRGLDDEGLTSSPPGILLALENIPWQVSFIPRQKKLRRLVPKVGTVQISNKIYFHTCWKDIWSMALLYGLWFPILLLIMKALTKVSGGNFPFFVVSHASVSFKLNNPNFYILGFLCPNLKLHFFHSGTLP